MSGMIYTLEITVLTDNIERENLACEWGLSVHILTDSKSILLDSGQSDLFYKNAETLGIDIKKIDIAVLSHAHYDHANGFERFLTLNDTAPVYLRDCCRENCFSQKENGIEYIGIAKGLMGKYPERFARIDGEYAVSDNIYLLPHSNKYYCNNGERLSMFTYENGEYIPDAFLHEQTLVIRSDKGLFVFNSCSHTGVCNIIKEVKDAFPNDKIYAYLGGFHLFKDSKEDVCRFAKEIADTEIQKFYTGHCTGDEAFLILKDTLGDRIEQLYCGKRIIV